MRYNSALTLSALLLTGAAATAAWAGPDSLAVPPASFINHHVSTVDDLTQQVSIDPVVRRRLARHFHTSGPAMVRYIQENLVLRKLPAAGRYQVYCISPSGREYSIWARLAAGTPVFVTKSGGHPILKLACGNPMVAALPPPVVTKTSPYVASMTTPKAASVPPALLPGNTPVLLASNTTPEVLVTPVPKVLVEAFPPALHISGGHTPLGFLAGIPILVGIFGHGGGGSTGSPNGTTGTTGTTGLTGTTGPGTTTTGTTTGTTGPGTTGPGTTTTGTTTGTTGPGTTTTGTTTGTTGPGLTTTGTTGTTTGTTGSNTGTTPVPEPSPASVLVVGGIALTFLAVGSKRRTRKAR